MPFLNRTLQSRSIPTNVHPLLKDCLHGNTWLAWQDGGNPIMFCFAGPGSCCGLWTHSTIRALQSSQFCDFNDPEMPLTLNIKMLSPQQLNFSVEVESSAKIVDLKKLLSEKSGLAPEQQKVIYAGRILADASTIESYGCVKCFGPCSLCRD